MKLRIAKVGASERDPNTGLPLAQVVSDITNDIFASVDNVPIYQALGVTASPYPADVDDHCEAFVVEDVAGLDYAVIGFRDPRAATIYGAIRPGDTVLHSTGPNLAAQVLLKEEEKQVAMMTKASDGKDCGIIIDGGVDEINITGFGCLINMKGSGQITIGNKLGSFGLDAQGFFFANTPGGSLGSGAVAPAQGIAYGSTGPVNLISKGWAVAARVALAEWLRIKAWARPGAVFA